MFSILPDIIILQQKYLKNSILTQLFP